MREISVRELATNQVFNEKNFTHRELVLAKIFLKIVADKLNATLKRSSVDDLEDRSLQFSIVENAKAKVGPGVRLTLTIFGFSGTLTLSSILALEIANRYLDKIAPAVDRELNKEEVAVVALITTLLISELREAGTSGIYLKSANVTSAVLETNPNDIVVEELRLKQKVVFQLEPDLADQLSQKSKLVLVGSPIEKVIAETSHTISLHLDAEVKSLSTLFKLRPGVLWRLGEGIWPTIKLKGEILGYGSLTISNGKESVDETA